MLLSRGTTGAFTSDYEAHLAAVAKRSAADAPIALRTLEDVVALLLRGPRHRVVGPAPATLNAMRALPLVKRCHEDFDAMKDGDCERCGVRVHDLSSRTEAEAAALIASPEVECVRFAVDRSGNIRFRAGVAAAAAITIAASSIALASSSSSPPSQKKVPDAGDASADVEPWMGRK
jgi:hypothetical protein